MNASITSAIAAALLLSLSFAPMTVGGASTLPAVIGTTGYCDSKISSTATCADLTRNNVARDCLDNNAASWHVEGKFTSGSGKVKFVLECGGTELVSCTADTVDVPCSSLERDAQAGELECKAIRISGNPDGISGSCVDPVHPDFVLEMVVVDGGEE